MKDIKEIIELIEELWDKHSESLPDDIHGLADEQGSVIMREKDFHKAIKEYHDQFPQPQQKEQFSQEDMWECYKSLRPMGYSEPNHRIDFEEWITEYLNSKTKPI